MFSGDRFVIMPSRKALNSQVLQKCEKNMNTKIFAGAKVKNLREASGMTLEVASRQLDLSPSYLSQIESNQRPVTARVLIALCKIFSTDPAEFDAGDETRLIADLREATADLALDASGPALSELKLAASTTPTFARQFLALHRAYRSLDERLKKLDETLSIRGNNGLEHQTHYQEVRDFFHYRNNYVDELDTAAEIFAKEIGMLDERDSTSVMETTLSSRFSVRIQHATPPEESILRRYNPVAKTLTVSSDLNAPTYRFQLAAHIAELAFSDIATVILDKSGLQSEVSRDIARIALTNYAAGALVMPYQHFSENAEALRYDIERLQKRYHASFEQICHRLGTLQRPSARGIPFYFVRVDRAGNITKRHSSTRFQFARFGGGCPLWNVHEAFGEPGKILVQLAEMPDGVRYLCIGRAIVKRSGSFSIPNRQFAVGIGCEVSHAQKLVYSAAVQIDGAAVPIGISCRICEREDCHQRAFPPLDRRIVVPVNERRIIPYSLA